MAFEDFEVEEGFLSENEAAKARIAQREAYLPKVQGSIIGGAAGDALGYAVEFMGDAQIRARYGEDGIRAYEVDPATGTAHFSDDTQMTLFTANGLLIGDTRGCLRGIGGAQASYCVHTYQDWLLTQDPGYKDAPRSSWLLKVPELHVRRAPGNTCISALMTGASGSTSNPINHSKGCGGVMRVAPIGLYWAAWRGENPAVDEGELLDHIVKDAAECAAITHGHPLGYISAGALAYIVHRVAFEIPADCGNRGQLLREIVADCCGGLPFWFPDHPRAAAYQAELLEDACRLALDSGSEAPGGRQTASGIASIGEGWVGEEALAIAVYACMRHPDDFGACIRTAANHGGDSDSTASIAGNISGAMLGLGAIGSEWTQHLECLDVLLEISKDLCDGCQMNECGKYLDRAWLRKY